MAITNKELKGLDLKSFIRKSKDQTLIERVNEFQLFINELRHNNEHSYFRLISSKPGPIVTISDTHRDVQQDMIMFASNNYLGLASHNYVKQKINAAIHKYGTGVGGPPILNGYTDLMNTLEKRLALLKHQEAGIIFPTGYSTNLGFVSALVKRNDFVLYDELSHASLYDGLKMTKGKSDRFKHNNLHDLESKLASYSTLVKGTIYVSMEGVYSMDGDLAPLDKMIPLIQKYGAVSMLDDAHGTGVFGENGGGSAEHFGVSSEIDITMGTFSKVFAVTGGFLAANENIINYIKYFARPYMFSAALPPMNLAAVLAGIDIIEQEPQLRDRLFNNSNYARELLKPFGFLVPSESPIIALHVPDWMNIRKANQLIHENGVYLNAIEYPAVPKNKQRFRISMMAQHSKEQIEKLAQVIDSVWNDKRVRI